MRIALLKGVTRKMIWGYKLWQRYLKDYPVHVISTIYVFDVETLEIQRNIFSRN